MCIKTRSCFIDTKRERRDIRAKTFALLLKNQIANRLSAWIVDKKSLCVVVQYLSIIYRPNVIAETIKDFTVSVSEWFANSKRKTAAFRYIDHLLSL